MVYLRKLVTLLLLCLLCQALGAQVRISGTVYERTARMGLSGVSVRSASGAGAVTDSMGRYSINLSKEDTIWFSYQGKPTNKFAVSEINIHRPLDIKMQVDVQVLRTVEVSSRKLKDYYRDSIENREEYRRVFDYQREYFSNSGGVAGLNLDLLFGIKKAKRMEAFRRLLEQDERDKYVDKRFNRALVARITGLVPPDLDVFMVRYRPSYEMLLYFANDYQFYEYIRDSGEYFKANRRRGK
ncbi:peptidase associated/transthyretin-like domain-containing protein [Chitinophaga vietnamensis]|uniref:carboxypeptidase-like regulatory domain-containing protein n=1 Tax=Chitinophaga vietnamensis TaxID=2593957 RepID=UPI001178C93A|nr:carboxypeptidase-like regulatory domain-containing protein [Chitinophaga vietnamensis]